MKIAVLSGKGGTGKTFVSVNLAYSLQNCTYIDCDVEEPNGHLFLKPTITQEHPVMVKIPTFDKATCVGCKACVDFCAFHALAFVKKAPLLFPAVCHNCGGCLAVCQHGAVAEVDKPLGTVQQGTAHGLDFLSGTMDIGEASAIPIIKELLSTPIQTAHTVIDCPPGSGCMVMESIQDADFCILVAEPTVFGAHNLEMVYHLTQLFHKPMGVVLNKCTPDANPSADFCNQVGLGILAQIPFDKTIAQTLGSGNLVCQTHPDIHALFTALIATLETRVAL